MTPLDIVFLVLPILVYLTIGAHAWIRHNKLMAAYKIKSDITYAAKKAAVLKSLGH